MWNSSLGTFSTNKLVDSKHVLDQKGFVSASCWLQFELNAICCFNFLKSKKSHIVSQITQQIAIHI